jgi:hypothetical protein
MFRMLYPVQGDRKTAFALCKYPSLACNLVAGLEDIQGKAEHKLQEGLMALLKLGKENMELTMNNYSMSVGHPAQAALSKGMVWGLIAGLVGTMIMDIVLMEALSLAGLPALTCFSIVGNTVASLSAKMGFETAGGVPLGIAAHYLIGPAVGAIYGAAAFRIEALRMGNLKKSILFAVLYIEILSQPILALTPVLLKMTTPQTIKWFSGSFVMHFIWGVVVGAVVNYGLGLKTNKSKKSKNHKLF